ncbi:MAG: hypothetical protein ABIF40_00610 [archaeon]
MVDIEDRVIEFAKDYTDTILDQDKVRLRLNKLVEPEDKRLTDLPNVHRIGKTYSGLVRAIDKYDTAEKYIKQIEELEEQGYTKETFNANAKQAKKDLVRLAYDSYAHVLAAPANLALKSPIAPHFLQWTINSSLFIGIAYFSATYGNNLFEQATPIAAFLPSFSSITRSGKGPKWSKALSNIYKSLNVINKPLYEKARDESLDEILNIISKEFMHCC